MPINHPILRCEFCGSPELFRTNTRQKDNQITVRYYRCLCCLKTTVTIDYRRIEMESFQKRYRRNDGLA